MTKDQKIKHRNEQNALGALEWWRKRNNYITKTNSQIKDKHWQYHFFFNKKVDWWFERCKKDGNIRSIILPNAIKSILEYGLISEIEENNLKAMIASPDEENWLMAISIVIKYKKQMKKENKTCTK